MKKKRQWAVYKGDKFLCMGTKEQIAKELGVTVSTVTYWHSNSYKQRYVNRVEKSGHKVLISLEGDEN